MSFDDSESEAGGNQIKIEVSTLKLTAVQTSILNTWIEHHLAIRRILVTKLREDYDLQALEYHRDDLRAAAQELRKTNPLYLSDPIQVLQSVYSQIDFDYQIFFKTKLKKDLPKHELDQDKVSFLFYRQAFSIKEEGCFLRIPKLGLVECEQPLLIKGKVKSVSLRNDGKKWIAQLHYIPADIIAEQERDLIFRGSVIRMPLFPNEEQARYLKYLIYVYHFAYDWMRKKLQVSRPHDKIELYFADFKAQAARDESFDFLLRGPHWPVESAIFGALVNREFRGPELECYLRPTSRHQMIFTPNSIEIYASSIKVKPVGKISMERRQKIPKGFDIKHISVSYFHENWILEFLCI